jgi:predicted P-loop ATPase
VFAGTINPPVGGYLTDPTGVRRFWPVACRGTIDRDGIERDRDQLWAEAVHRYKAGAKWFLEMPELEALATDEHAKRFKGDSWREPIKQWIGRRTDVSINEVLNGALRIEPTDPPNHSAEIRITEILKAMGFKKYRARRGRDRPNRYRRNRGDMFAKRRKLIEAWSKYCCTPPVVGEKQGTVLTMRGRA